MKKKAYIFSKKSLKILNELEEKEGKVHSIFKHSINILTPKNRLLTLLSKEREIHKNPISIVIDEINFEKWNIQKGENVRYLNNKITISNKVDMDTTNKITWDSSFRYFGPLSSSKIIQKNVESLKFFIKVMGWDKGMLPLVVDSNLTSIYTEKARGILEEFIDYPKNFSKLKGLIGLGDGLTPSGDDFLSGFFIVLFYFTKYLNINEIKEHMDEFKKEIPRRTNIISATFLTLAIEGEAFFLLREIIKDLLFRRAYDMENIRALIEYGGTSGASILAGLIFGIDYVLTHLYREVKEVTV